MRPRYPLRAGLRLVLAGGTPHPRARTCWLRGGRSLLLTVKKGGSRAQLRRIQRRLGASISGEAFCRLAFTRKHNARAAAATSSAPVELE